LATDVQLWAADENGDPRKVTVNEILGEKSFEFKAASYADFPALETGLATETAAGWDPAMMTNRAGGVGETLIVIYRRALA
jgi:hypothetical protein